MILYGMQRSMMGRYACGLSEGLFDFRRATALAWCHTFGNLNEQRQAVQKYYSHFVALLPWYCMNSE